MSLRLVEHAYTDATMFTAEGEVVQPAEMLYQRPILVERGRFRPVNLLTRDLLEKAVAQFRAEPELNGEEPAVLMEITLRDLIDGEGVDERDFLDRIDTLRTIGQPVLISNHGPYYRLVENLNHYTRKKIGIAVGVPALNSILDEKHYEDLPGGTLEAAGRLFARNVRMYVYPRFDAATGTAVTAETLNVPPHLRHLYAHLLENRHVLSIQACNPNYRAIDSDLVLRQIQEGNPAWEKSVPEPVAELIREKHLFGWSVSRHPKVMSPGGAEPLPQKPNP
jgi:hypothetical protein